MTAITEALSAALIHFVWQGSIVGFLLWIMLFALRTRSANARYIAACAALAALAVMPVITTAVLYLQDIPIAAGVRTAADISKTVTAWSVTDFRAMAWLARLQSWALPVWSLGVLLFSARLVLGCKHAFALGRRGAPARESIVAMIAVLAKRMRVDRPVRVLISSMAEAPSVVGWLRPVILLPASTVLGLTPQQLEAVLAHELAHVRRYDYLVNILQMLVETLFFYHPAVWWTSKRIRLERELCCDDLAVRSCGDAAGYARALTTLEKLRLTAPSPAEAVMSSTGGPLLYRIQRLIGVTTEGYRPSRLSAVIAICLGLACLAFNVNWLRGQARNVPAHEEPQAAAAPDSPGVRVDMGGSSVLHRTAVGYPEALARQGIQGTVRLEVTLDKNGVVSDARVLSGPEELRKTALQSALNWHFTRDAARSTRQISIVFEPPPVESQTEAEIARKRAQLEEVSRLLEEQAKMRAATQRSELNLTGRQQLERQLAEVRKRLEQDSQDGNRGSVEELNIKLKTLQARFAASRPEGRQLSAAGRTLKSIDVDGLPEPVRADFLSRLPVREGDTLSRDSLEAISQAARDFDEHFRIRITVFLTDDDQVRMQIAVTR